MPDEGLIVDEAAQAKIARKEARVRDLLLRFIATQV